MTLNTSLPAVLGYTFYTTQVIGFSVPHDRIFRNALERNLKREKMGTEPTTHIEPIRAVRTRDGEDGIDMAVLHSSKKRAVEDEAPALLAESPPKSVLRASRFAPSATRVAAVFPRMDPERVGHVQAQRRAGRQGRGAGVCLSLARAEAVRASFMSAHMRALTPEDIDCENLFRAAQRIAGKSRMSSITDPNVLKKPLSACCNGVSAAIREHRRLFANHYRLRDADDDTERARFA
ncbi:hypothetical protein HYPSUDRAFT_198905 [Hypholoma sublateritium FD-334 SS-4]|uniref:Uncharacterized protein n=1 Tax=Hypholoma sublateritium (strain FD-334 SS-4) TaxID=945553 RepID=A0A0D2PDP0_HYPSF|nr:hypothetical protein HYPSUDRAFT_198905 [Hypholoma sublateritium FD-334 SS-4]